MALGLVFLSAAIYWGSGLGTNAAWNTWIETVVPPRLRGYFSRRTRFSRLALLVSFVAGGVTLHFAKQSGHLLAAFAGLFILAALCRFVSAGLLTVISEPMPLATDHRHVSLREWLRRAHHGVDGRLLTYLFAVQTAAQLAGPYFTPYMLRTLQLSYGRYVVLIAVSFAAKALTLPLLGNLAQRYGAQRLLRASGIAIVPVASFWIFSDNFYYLIGVQTIAGISWAPTNWRCSCCSSMPFRGTSARVC